MSDHSRNPDKLAAELGEMTEARDELARQLEEVKSELVRARELIQEEIEERKQAEDALQDGLRRLELAMHGADLGLWDWSLATGRGFVNRRSAEILGYALDEIDPTFDLWLSLLHPEDRTRALDAVNAHIEGRSERYEDEYRVKTKSGDWRWVFSQGKVVERDSHGKPLRMVGTYRDITVRKNAQKALRLTEDKYSALFENISDGVAIYRVVGDGEDFVFTDFNKAAETITGVGREQVVGRSISDAFPGVEDFGLLDVMRTAWKTGKPVHHPVRKYEDSRIEIWIDNFVCRLPWGEVVAVFRDETERMRSEEALRSSEARYRTLIENAPIGILSMNKDGSILDVNAKLLEILGSPSGEATKAINMLQFDPLRRAGISEVFLKCMDEARGQTAEILYTSKWGKTLYLRMILTPLFDETGSVSGCQAVMEDVTARRVAEDALMESRRTRESILAAAPVGIALHRDGAIQWANEAWAKMFGFESRDRCVGRSTASMYQSEEEYRKARDILYEGLETGMVREIDVRLRRIDGAVFDATVRTRALDSSDLSKGVIGSVSDVSERKKAEKALVESEEKYRATFNNAGVGIDLVDSRGKFVEVNDTLCSFLGYSEDELRDLSILDVTHPEDAQVTRERFAALVRGEIACYRLEKRYVRKDGGVVWADTSVSAIRDYSGRHLSTVGVIADITRRRRSEQIRRRLAIAVEQASETIEITDTLGNIVYVNPAFEKNTGYSRKEAMGKNPRILKSGVHDELFYKDMWDAISSGRAWSGHLVNRKKDGTLFEEEVSITPIKEKSGKIVNYVAVKRDVSKERSLQAQLLHSQKMEAVGTLAGGIAHDFNNLLQVTLGYSELLLQEKDPEDPEYADLQKIFLAARSGAELVRRMLTFSRKVEFKPVVLNLNRRITLVEKLLRRTIPRMIDIEMDLADDLAEIHADPAQVEQVLMNLALNARDALAESGKIGIVTGNVTLDKEYCSAHVGTEPGKYVLLQVSDTGHGMDKGTIEHIFEPFFTTKELGRGTGLGLATVYGIVNQHGGHITCESEPGKGTTFRAYFPAVEPQGEAEGEPSGDFPPLGTETVLLVDDEEFVREFGERILIKGGYSVLTAVNGREACEVFQSNRNRISLVILDLIMPGMGGEECLRELRMIDPDLKVIVASGYSAGTSVQRILESGADAFVDKPFRVKELLGHVRDVLDAD